MLPRQLFSIIGHCGQLPRVALPSSLSITAQDFVQAESATSMTINPVSTVVSFLFACCEDPL
jgi:hypothetical protein